LFSQTQLHNRHILRRSQINIVQKLFLFFVTFFRRSGSGKSTLVKSQLARIAQKHKVFLLNVRPDEAETYKKVHSNTELICSKNLAEGLAQVKKGSYVIIEDIICVSRAEEEAIRMVLNYRAHHDKLRVICIGHMLYRTHLLTLVPLFNYLVFTLVNASRGLLKTAATFGFHLDREETSQWLEEFTSRCASQARKGFMFVECSSIALYYHSSDGEDKTKLSEKLKEKREVAMPVRGGKQKSKTKLERIEKLNNPTELPAASTSTAAIEQKFESCFLGQANASLACALFGILARVLKEQKGFRDFDLSLAFEQSRKPGKIRRVSIVDYVCALLNERASAPPITDHLVVHRFLSERCKIPAIFIRNPYFWSTTSDISSDERDTEEEADGTNPAGQR